MGRKLVVFDVDGTLTETFRIDEICFLRSMASALGLHEVNPDWASYSDCTDVGVVREAFLSRFGRYPTGRELAGYVEAFVRLLEEAHRSDPTAFSAVKGASQLLEALAATGEWSVSIATGCWERSARLKLRLAHLSVDGLPFASCDDSPSREVVVRTSIQRAEANVQDSFERIVLVGDGVWDVRTARGLRHSFVGRGIGRRARTLVHAGATRVLADFSDVAETMTNLDGADVPIPERLE